MPGGVVHRSGEKTHARAETSRRGRSSDCGGFAGANLIERDLASAERVRAMQRQKVRAPGDQQVKHVAPAHVVEENRRRCLEVESHFEY